MRKPTRVAFDRQALRASAESTLKPSASSPAHLENLDEANTLSQSDSVALDSNSIFREQEEGSDKVRNYVDHEKAFKSDMQMINYKSRLPDLLHRFNQRHL